MRQTKESRTRSDSVGTERALEDFPKSRQGRIRRGRRAPQSRRVPPFLMQRRICNSRMVVAIWPGGRRLNEAALHLAASAASGDNGVVKERRAPTWRRHRSRARKPARGTDRQCSSAAPNRLRPGLASTDCADAQSDRRRPNLSVIARSASRDEAISAMRACTSETRLLRFARNDGGSHSSRAPLTPPCSRIAARCRLRRSICRGGTCPTW